MGIHIRSFDLLLMFLGGIVLLFIIAPLANMFFATPLNDIFDTVNDSEVTRSIWLTLSISIVGTLLFSIFAIPLAYLLARKNFPFKKLISGIIDMPIVIPHSAAGIAILGLISRNSIPGKFASDFGFNLIGSQFSIALAMAFVSIPFLINAARDGFANVPVRLEKAALNLGAKPLRVFFTISIPLAWRNITSGLVLMFARGISEFGAIVIVAYHPMVTPVLIYERFSAFGLKYARPVSVVFVTISLIIFIGIRILSDKKRNAES